MRTRAAEESMDLLFIYHNNFLTICSHKGECILYRDMYIRYEMDNSSVTITFGNVNLQGWAGFGFSFDKTIHNTSLLWTIDESYDVRQMVNHTVAYGRQNGSIIPVFLSGAITTQLTLSFRVVVPRVEFFSQNYMFFVSGSSGRIGQTPHDTSSGPLNITAATGLWPKNCLGSVFPHVIHAWKWYTYVILITILLALSALVFALMRYYPLKSRGLVPVTMIFSWFLSFTLPFLLLGVWDNADRNRNWCYSRVFTTTSHSTAVFQYFFNFLRYLLIINLNKYRMALAAKQVNRSNLLIRFLNLVTRSYWFFVVQYIFTWLILAAGGIMAMGISTNGQFYCDAQTRVNLGIYTIVASFVPHVSIGILAAIDAIVHIRTLFTKRHWFIEDPYYYRIECYFTSTLIAFFVLIYTVIDLTRSPGVWFQPMMGLFSYIFVFLSMPMFITCVTIYKLIKDHYMPKKVQTNSPLEKLFRNPLVLAEFKEFARHEWSIENVLCKEDLYHYRKCQDSEKREQIANLISGMYLCRGESVMEVNLSNDILNRTNERIKKMNFSDDLFFDVEREVDMNLNDTFSRFSYTETWLKVENADNYQKSLATLASVWSWSGQNTQSPRGK